jgi:hypothetical protein
MNPAPPVNRILVDGSITKFPRFVYSKHQSVTQNDAVAKQETSVFHSKETDYKLLKANALRIAAVYIQTHRMRLGGGVSMYHLEQTRPSWWRKWEQGYRVDQGHS